MTRFLLVFGHGRQEGLGCALRDRLSDVIQQAGGELRIHNLLEDGFDPVLRLSPDQPVATLPAAADDPLAASYGDDVQWADILVFVHPVWWFSVPAILKGWIDRILVEGVAISQQGGGPPRGLLTGKNAILVQTFGTNRMVERTLFRGLTRGWWKRAVFLPTGLSESGYVALHDAGDARPAELDSLVARFGRILKKL